MNFHLEAFLALLEKVGYGFGNRAAFAHQAGISPAYLHGIVHGTKSPSDKTIVAMAHALDVPLPAITIPRNHVVAV